MCLYILDNPQNPQSSAVKIAPSKVVEKINMLIEGNKLYTEGDFERMKITIFNHKNKREKEDLLTILRMFSHSGGTTADQLLSIIQGSKIDFDRKALLVYLMKKSKSIVKISSIALNDSIIDIFRKNAMNPQKSQLGSKSSQSTTHNRSITSTTKDNKKIYKMAHMNLGSDADLDPNSLGYKLRKALKIYLSRKVGERIQAFTRGDSLNKEEIEEDEKIEVS